MPIAFSQPLLLTLLPLALLFMIWLQRHGGQVVFARRAIYHPQAALLRQLAEAEKPSASLLQVAILLALAAISGPYWRGWSAEVPTLGRNIMLAIDVSGSMRAFAAADNNDTPLSRLGIVREAAKKLVAANPQDRFGIIVFADEAITLLPLNDDHRFIAEMITNLKTGLLGERTALGDAIALASEQLSHVDARSRLLILFSDGHNTAGTLSPELAVTLAKTEKVRIFSLAIGRSGPVFFPQGPMKAPVLTQLPLDEQRLASLATLTAGKFYRSNDLASLTKILADIADLARVELPAPAKAGQSLVGGLLLLVLLLLLTHFWRQHLTVQP